MASSEIHSEQIMFNPCSQSNGILSICPTDSEWFIRWSCGCKTYMGYILKQNQAITTSVLKGLTQLFAEEIKNSDHHKIQCLNTVIILSIPSYHSMLPYVEIKH